MKNILIVTMPDRSQWSIPVKVIAQHRAEHFAERLFEGSVQRSMEEDTAPLFERNAHAIERWSQEMMDWDDVKDHATQTSPPQVNYREGWEKGARSLA